MRPPRSWIVRLVIGGLTLAALAGPCLAEGELRLIHPTDDRHRRISGDGQVATSERGIQLSALVLDAAGEPLPHAEVLFEQLAPTVEDLGLVRSDGDGLARLFFTGGDKTGAYTVVARITGATNPESRIVFHLPVRSAHWILFMTFGLAGGLGLFLLGMEMMSSSLQRTAGGRMRAILGALTRNRFVGVAVGAFVTMVIQSSSATTVMLVSLVQAQLMSFPRTLGVILGADVGTTITAQIIAFKLIDYALPMIAVGFGMKYVARRRTVSNLGAILLGFGILFFGMSVMTTAMYPLRTYRPFLLLLGELENPLLGILAGAIFTALIQSSSAFTGILIVLAQQGLLTLDAGVPLIFGANIGTCVTAFLASLKSSRDAKRVALAHTLFKVLGVLLCVAWIPYLVQLVSHISPGGSMVSADPAAMSRYLPRQIANAHTIFNVGLTILFLPFTGLMGRLVLRILPDIQEDEQPRSRFLDPEMLSTPSLALNLAKVQIVHMGNVVHKMATRCIEPFIGGSLEVCSDLRLMEQEVDQYESEISHYLLRIGQQDIASGQAQEVYLMLNVCKLLEHIGDMVDKHICPLALKKADACADFSESGRAEVKAFHLKMVKQIARSMEAFREGSLDQARHVKAKQKGYWALEVSYRQSHFDRIRDAVTESMATSEIHLDLMDAMRHITSYATNIARAILDKLEKDPEEQPELPTDPSDP